MVGSPWAGSRAWRPPTLLSSFLFQFVASGPCLSPLREPTAGQERPHCSLGQHLPSCDDLAHPCKAVNTFGGVFYFCVRCHIDTGVLGLFSDGLSPCCCSSLSSFGGLYTQDRGAAVKIAPFRSLVGCETHIHTHAGTHTHTVSHAPLSLQRRNMVGKQT